MNQIALYNLDPAAQLLMFGALLAVFPMGWVLWKARSHSVAGRQFRLTLFTLFLTFDLVVFGSFTRLTDSGLGCPDWPGCYGQTNPMAAHTPIEQAQQTLPSGPVTHQKAWIEMIHRYLATSVGALLFVLFLWACWRRFIQMDKSTSVWWPGLTLIWVCLQGAFGALTVTMKLFPAIVTLHLFAGLVLLALLTQQVWQFRAGSYLKNETPTGQLKFSSNWHLLIWGGTVILIMQILLGAWVSTNYAVLACETFPQCQESWWPAMDFSTGFQIWRPLGLVASGELLPFDALTAIHYAHRLMSYMVACYLLGLAFLIRRRLQKHADFMKWSRNLIAVILMQFFSGVSNVVLGWPMLAALMHTAGAALLLALMTWGVNLSRPQQRN